MIIGFPCPDPVKGLLIFVGDTETQGQLVSTIVIS